MPQLWPNLTTFHSSNSTVLHLIISGLSRQNIFITPEEESQDISEKCVKILTEKTAILVLG